MRVLCLTFGDSTQGSTFFRIHQYIEPLVRRGIHLEPVPARKFDRWSDLAKYDAILLQKALLPTAKLRKLRRDTQRLFYDIDDAIWHPHGQRHFFLTNLRQALRLKTILRAADHSIAANQVLADHLRKFTTRVSVVPMALDETIWTPRPPAPDPNIIRVGWSGHPVNLIYLEEIEAALLRTQARFPNVEFAIFSGQRPRLRSLKFTYLPFAPGAEPEIIRTFDIGLLPLPDDDFSGGKSPIKALQYMACGIPTLLAPLGAAAQMFEDGKTALFARNPREWESALTRLIADPSLRARLGAQARLTFETTYTVSRTTPQLASILLNEPVISNQKPK